MIIANSWGRKRSRSRMSECPKYYEPCHKCHGKGKFVCLDANCPNCQEKGG